jgi:hypothetical protein
LIFAKEYCPASRAGKDRGNDHGDFCRHGRNLPTSRTSSMTSYCRRRSRRS